MSYLKPKPCANPSTLIECFSVFFEKVAGLSENPSLNMKQLSSFKDASYNNLNSTEGLLKAVNLFTQNASSPLSPKRLSPTNFHVPQSYTPNRSQSPQRNNFSLKLPFTDKASSSPRAREHNPAAAAFHTSFHLEGEQGKILQTTYYQESVSNFLSNIGASSHPEYQKLNSLAKNCTSIRILPEREETIFNAVCCAFYEKLLKISPFDIPKSEFRRIFEHSEWVQSQMFLFTTLIKSLSQDSDISAKTIKFYENLSRDQNLHQKGVAAFKEIVEKLFKQTYHDSKYHLRVFFKWMNEFDSLCYEIIGKIANILQTTLKFFILTDSTLKEEKFSYVPAQPETSSFFDEFTIFYDKTKDQAYILSPAPENNNTFNASSSPINSARILNEFSPRLKQEGHHLEFPSPTQNFEKFSLKIFPIHKERQVEQRYGVPQTINHRDPQSIKIKPSYNTATDLSTNITITPPPLNNNVFENHIKPPEDLSSLGSRWLSDASLSDSPPSPHTAVELKSSAFATVQQEKESKSPTTPVVTRNLSMDYQSAPVVKKDLYGMSVPPLLPKRFVSIFSDIMDASPVHSVQTPNRIFHKGKDPARLLHAELRTKSLRDVLQSPQKSMSGLLENKAVKFSFRNDVLIFLDLARKYPK